LFKRKSPCSGKNLGYRRSVGPSAKKSTLGRRWEADQDPTLGQEMKKLEKKANMDDGPALKIARDENGGRQSSGVTINESPKREKRTKEERKKTA